MKESATVFLALAFAALLTTACDDIDSAPDRAVDSGQSSILRRGNGDDPATLDPAMAEDVHAFNVLVDLYEGLLAEAADGTLIPGVANSWHISDDLLVYTFELRADAQWSDGETVTAENFVAAFRRVVAPETLSPYSFLLESIRNFHEISEGTTPATTLGVTAIDDRTLEIRLSEPNSHFLSVLAMPIAFPVNVSNPVPSQFSRPAEFIGNGPYVLAERRVGEQILLRRNEKYWDSQSVSIREVMYLPIIDSTTELNMYQTGEVDITGTIPSGRYVSFREMFREELRVAPALALYYLAFDLTEPPLDNRALRQALSMAIDRKQLVELIANGEAPAYGIVPPGVANHRHATYDWRDDEITTREERARDFFRLAGYDANNPLKLKLMYDVGSIHEFIALSVSSMWTEVLGIEVELEKKEWKLFLDSRDNRPSWQVMRFNWFGDYNDAMTFAEIFRSDSPQNLARYKSSKFDDLIDQASSETDPNIRRNLMNEAEAALLGDYPVVPLYFYVSKHLVKPHIRGFEDNILDRHPSRFLSFVRDND